jgi:hypothetical protein
MTKKSAGGGLEGFLSVCTTPSARTVPIKIRPCEECGAAPSESWPAHLPAVAAKMGGRTLLVAYFCDDCGAKFRRMLQAKLQQIGAG